MEAALLEGPELDAAGHMAMDEAVLRGAGPGPRSGGGEAVYLRIYRWPGPGRGPVATFGYFQRHADVARALSGRGPVPAMTRRPTGGGIVLHDCDVTFSIVFPWARLGRVREIYRGIHGAVLDALKDKGLACRLWDLPGAGTLQAACFAGPSPMDLVHPDGDKFLGGALRRAGRTGLYQGSLRPEGFGERAALAAGAVVDGAGRRWGAGFAARPVPADVMAMAGRLREEKYATEAWNRLR